MNHNDQRVHLKNLTWSPLYNFCYVHTLHYQLEIGPLLGKKKWRGSPLGKQIWKVKMLKPKLLKTMKRGPIQSTHL